VRLGETLRGVLGRRRRWPEPCAAQSKKGIGKTAAQIAWVPLLTVAFLSLLISNPLAASVAAPAPGLAQLDPASRL
jgi:hypothetical protein